MHSDHKLVCLSAEIVRQDYHWFSARLESE
jgi:hypothetical protein